MRTSIRLLAGICLWTSAAPAAVVCVSSAVPTLVSSEGLTERMGDIVFNCSGGTPGQNITGNLTLFLSVTVTNRTGADGRTDVALTIDNGSTPAPPTLFATPYSALAVAFNNLSFNLSPSGAAILRVTNLRGAAAQQTGFGPITVSAAFNGPLPITNPSLTVGQSSKGLLSSSSSANIYCVGSPMPSASGLTALFAAGTAFHSTRVTEGWADAFQKRAPGADSATRIMARYTGLPPGARLFAPDFVAGSNSVQPTAGGDLGVAPSGGQYTGGSGALLLALVRYADAFGAGGTRAGTGPPPGVTAAFDSVSEVLLQDGAGVVVYEVVDSSPTQQESAQFPIFLAFTPPPGGLTSTVVARQEVSFAPLSTTATMSPSAPVPRYAYFAPPPDCRALGDCDASYFPRLFVDSPPLSFTAPAGSAFQVQYIRVNNEGGGILNWTVSVNYRGGAGWLRLDTVSGRNNATIRVDVLPEKLTPGVYEADVTIDAGPLAGSRTLRVRLEVTAFVPLPPSIRAAVNAATFESSPLVAGSLATLFGARFSGRDLSVTFDGLAARVLFSKDDQINLLLPAELAGRAAAQVIVKADGVASAPLAVKLAPFSPGIFGTLNQDYTRNATGAPAPVDTVIQVFVTGLDAAGAWTVLGRVHDRDPAPPLYAGPAPGFPGLQQVNIRIPADLPAMTTDVRICGEPPVKTGERVCSPPSRITLSREPF